MPPSSAASRFRRAEAAPAQRPGPGRALTLLALLSAACAALPPPAPAEPGDYWRGPLRGPVPATLAGATVIDTGALLRLLDEAFSANHAPVLIDASDPPRRPANLPDNIPWLPAPHRSIRGAVWMPGAGAPDLDEHQEHVLKQHLLELTGGDPQVPIVVFCHESCWLSWNAARRILAAGYRNVLWYPAGIEGWAGVDGATGISSTAALPEAANAR